MMVDTKFTPGPLRAMFNNEGKMALVTKVFGEMLESPIVVLKRNENGKVSVTAIMCGNDAEDLANADLYAASPDLYHALKALVYEAESPTDDGSTLEACIANAKAALAKADGKEGE